MMFWSSAAPEHDQGTDRETMTFNESGIRAALEAVIDPELDKSIVTLGLIEQIKLVDGQAEITVSVGTDEPQDKREALDRVIKEAVGSAAQMAGTTLRGIEVVFARKVSLSAQSPSAPPPPEPVDESNPLPGVKHVIAVGAGKGGVGKSTATVSLALGLARAGARVGLLDGDIYGPSIPTMLGLDDAVPQVKGTTMVPFEAFGIKSISIGKLVDPDKALIWRGPMAHGAFKQLALQTDWGELDYLLVDLPPGTGDVPLTLAQLLPLTGAVLICTPQRVAQDDARRAARMFQQLDVEILGVIENMSSFTGDDGKEYDLFGKGGAEILARTMGLPFLGNLPIHPELRKNLDEGRPDRNFSENPALAEALDALATNLANRISIASLSDGASRPSLEIS